ncbi:MAG TPA: indole-3-glycerol phosphate synthase TrpC [Candidatus Sumerlaeota bacterium]|nr:indole-3-glycerol phosphate synthase TrpC [Candidatus Sumerlaeota bacterium]
MTVEKIMRDTSKFGPILQRIVEAKEVEVARARAALPLDEVRARALDRPPARDFRGALVRPGEVRLIAEVKKASPSKGLIRPDFDPEAIARAYEAGGAACISVLTDAPFFQGSSEIFAQVRNAVDLPLLRKEFMIDEYQFYEARAMGADAVLLITSILTPTQLADFHGLAQSLGMAVLVETHSEEDLRRALTEIQPCLLGINNRDLHDSNFKTSIDHTERMLPVIRERTGGPLPPVVSESGIYTADDVLRLRRLGISAVLVGESLMRQPDPGAAARALMVHAAGE